MDTLRKKIQLTLSFLLGAGTPLLPLHSSDISKHVLFSENFCQCLSLSGYLLLKQHWPTGDPCISVMSNCPCLWSGEGISCLAFVLFYFLELGLYFLWSFNSNSLASFSFSLLHSAPSRSAKAAPFSLSHSISYHPTREPGKRSTDVCISVPKRTQLAAHLPQREHLATHLLQMI